MWRVVDGEDFTTESYVSSLTRTLGGPNLTSITELELYFYFNNFPLQHGNFASFLESTDSISTDHLAFHAQSGYILPHVTSFGLTIIHSDISSFEMVVSVMQHLRLPRIESVKLQVGPKTIYESWARGVSAQSLAWTSTRIHELIPEKQIVSDLALEVYQNTGLDSRTYQDGKTWDLYLNDIVTNMCQLTNFSMSSDTNVLARTPLPTLPHFQRIEFIQCAHLHFRLLRECIIVLKNTVWTRRESSIMLKKCHVIHPRTSGAVSLMSLVEGTNVRMEIVEDEMSNAGGVADA